MPAKVILYIDDEVTATRQYRAELTKAGYEVIHHRTADGGCQHLVAHVGEIDALVLDMMMPTPSGVDTSDTRDGLETGLWVLSQARQVIEDRPLPVLVLTNARAVAIAQTIVSRVLIVPPELVTCHNKHEVSAKELPVLVAGRL